MRLERIAGRNPEPGAFLTPRPAGIAADRSPVEQALPDPTRTSGVGCREAHRRAPVSPPQSNWRARLRVGGTQTIDLAQEMEAPPGFEPGMEVLQISEASLPSWAGPAFWYVVVARSTSWLGVSILELFSNHTPEPSLARSSPSWPRCDAAPWTAAQVLGPPRLVGRQCGVSRTYLSLLSHELAFNSHRLCSL
jgi:hypothetical protein